MVRQEGARQVSRQIDHYSLDAILAVGYRVRSSRGTQFRRWATEHLSEYLVKGFTLDDERLKNPPVGTSAVPDRFGELLERIRDIRSSERRMYLRVREIFASLLARGSLVLVVNPRVLANNVAELVALAKASPGKLNYGSGSSSAQVATELFQQSTGVKFNYVPYKANPPAVLDLVGGQTDLMIVDFTTTLPQVKAGKLRALGVSSAKRSPLVPNVPAIAESLPGYEFGYWNALYAPAGTPPAVVNKLNELMRDALATAAVRDAIERTGQEVAFMGPEELAKFQLGELERWGRIIKAAGIQPE